MAKPDGTVMDGNTRVRVLDERGVDVNALPREKLPGNSPGEAEYPARRRPTPNADGMTASELRGEGMVGELYWIEVPVPGRLAIMPRPRAGDWLEDEIAGWQAAGVGTVISLLEPSEVEELGLSAEAGLCRDRGMDFINFPIADRGVPNSIAPATSLARTMRDLMREGKAIAVHCRAGIGRSASIAASAMVCVGLPPEGAFEAISTARRVQVPDTPEQREWVAKFSERLTLDA